MQSQHFGGDDKRSKSLRTSWHPEPFLKKKEKKKKEKNRIEKKNKPYVCCMPKLFIILISRFLYQKTSSILRFSQTFRKNIQINQNCQIQLKTIPTPHLEKKADIAIMADINQNRFFYDIQTTHPILASPGSYYISYPTPLQYRFKTSLQNGSNP